MLTAMITSVLFTFAVVLVILKNIKYLKLAKQIKCNLRAWPLLGHVYLLFGSDEDRMNIIMKFGINATENGGMTKMWLGPYLFIVISDAIEAKAILKRNLEKGEFLRKVTKYIVGDGSIFAPAFVTSAKLKGQRTLLPIEMAHTIVYQIRRGIRVQRPYIVNKWRLRRKDLVSAFNSNMLKQYMKVFSNQSTILVKNMEKDVNKEPFSIWPYLTKYSMDSICENNLGINLKLQEQSVQTFLRAFEELSELIVTIGCEPWIYNETILKILYPSRYKIYKKNSKVLNGFIEAAIQRKREIWKKNSEENISNGVENKRMKTFLELLMQTSDGEQVISDIALRDELMTIILAGTDTSSVGICFTISMLARNQDVQAEVYKELQDIFQDSDRPVTWEDLPRMKYLEAVIKESLRLYPPVPIILREITENFTLCITVVPGTHVMINIWAVNRNPKYWGHDAEVFRPQRFLDDNQLSSTAFIGFSYGPRNCIGYQYAMMSMKTTVANIVRNYRVLPVGDQESPIRLQYTVMMKDVENYMTRLEKRNES